jgi:hypothetical protein
MARAGASISWLSQFSNALKATLQSRLSAKTAVQKSTIGLNWLRSVSHTLDRTKFTFALCIAFAIVVAMPDQTLELYRYTAESLSPPGGGVIKSLIAIVELLTVSYLFLSIARFNLIISSHTDRERRRTSVSVFVVLASLPSLAVAYGLLRARIDVSSAELKQVLINGLNTSFARDDPNLIDTPLISFAATRTLKSILSINRWLTAGATVLTVLSVAFGLAVYLHRGRILNLKTPFITAGLKLATLFLAGPIVAALFFLIFPVSLPQFISAFGLICLFFAVLLLFIRSIGVWGTTVQLPLLLFLMFSAIIFNFFDLNANHQVRELSEHPGEYQLIDSASAFQEWLKHRRDSKQYAEVSYPVYVVAAEGGGIYAAFRTAILLASLQDLCPRFAHHLFAISSVSGGSVGAAIFNGLIQKKAEPFDALQNETGCQRTGEISLADLVEEMLQNDLFSPVLAAFLFPDFIQRFLPFKVPSFDRARALENSIEASWNAGIQSYEQHKYPATKAPLKRGNPLSAPFASSWNPDSDAPALLINCTDVISGERKVIAPFAVDGELSNLPLRDISVSTAAVLSARFPWLTPPAWYPVKDNTGKETAVELVDGGYFDNSGVMTALALVKKMQRVSQQAGRRVQIRLIVLTSEDFSPPTIAPGDYLVPIQALLTARAAQAQAAITQAQSIIEGMKPDQNGNSPLTLRKLVLKGYGYPLPLGWMLAPITQYLILGQNGVTQCGKESPGSLADELCTLK